MRDNHGVLLGLVWGGIIFALAPISSAGETRAPQPVNYARPFEPPTRPAFIPLPPGAVEPGGWLRDWCLAARDGFTGHMDEYDDEFKRAWAADHKMTGERLFWYKGAWPYEGGGYWFDGLARLGYALHDEAPLCCTAALNRIVPWYVTHMWMATYDNGLAATCYGPCKVTARVADGVPVVVTCQTDYPFNETIAISVQPERKATFPLDFRIPGWCTAPDLEVNGSPVAIEPNSSRFIRIHRTWKPGDTMRLHFPMTARVRVGRDGALGALYDGAH